jgi:hypothetical protein
MTDLPYTDDDLRAEAARQHAISVEDPDFMGIGERMQGRFIHYEAVDQEHGDLMPPPGTPRWDELTEEEFEAAQHAIDDLIAKAADLSEWAVNLGADGLEPTGHTVQLGVDPGDGDRPRVRLHFAFHPDMPDADRDHFVMGLSKVVLRNL